MAKTTPIPPIHVLNEWLYLEDGVLYWKKQIGNIVIGSKFGWVCKNAHTNYIRGTIPEYGNFQAHRLIYQLYHPETTLHPDEQIDHINRDGMDNSYSNLRKVSPQVNQQNKSVYSNSRSGITGVSWYTRNGKWRARIQYTDKLGTKHNKLLGYYTDLLDAVTARQQAEAYYGFHPNHGKTL